ncbi:MULTISPECIES: 50S ribosomal protein L3 N(5)-glutamine methyltransferase [Psychrobacter]|jgi:ribosomal protein L3 glutamine methyltransferase|uniref:50S ribosomal protein L3 N(5)-glutamine methyltransferase n=1 Tax=Psychrobacter TaxID=497 RepID=UPI0004358474|nr:MULTISPECIES: 50S ribosomal protein L3 N(5)-glutamine methyltransferase [Psychrobacter]MBE8608634.1 50S ribosomal protein L3 N(5)-glutamine methyltransferase [Pseudomonas lundensis]WLG14588.1 50S ribosomal protein L3 N(5)-glutamine methyltransferase [Psychrobacter cibarius]GAF60642.1 protein-N(5)-glutamine methyltransferase PrmB, methylates LSU ribosomal protein L3p [Psychrobacter sp. JCM 18903]HCI75196.1 50S ribosomal protein L3 N(5)-glutamine methyltransferase [Psychrobacter sp.]
MSEDQTMSAEEFQNQYFNDDGLESEMVFDLESGILGEDDQFANLPAELEEAREQLVSIRDFIRFSVTQLRNYDVVVAQGTTDEFAEASAIVLHSLALDWSANEQILDCRLTTSEKQLVLSLLEERIAERKPLSYLINLSYFCDLPFYVDERVLIPRSPIAELIRQQFHPYFDVNELAKPLGKSVNEQAAAFYDHGLEVKQLSQPERILDLCTGSGCIAIALATRFVDALVDAVDIDKSALEVAMVNVDHHDLGHQVNVIESDLFAKIPAEHQYELIVTNPPYVDAAIMAELPPEFLYEPEHALAAGQDGLDLVHRILFEAPDYLSPEGLLVCEVGDSEWALKQAYPEIQFDWLKFAHGGHGVFAITYDELMAHRELFNAYVQLLDSIQ